MWGLHIMDWVERDNIDNILLKVFSFIALITAITGIVLFFKPK
jgi:sorbitol-specific phosphotransferase system component IIBC